MKWNNPFARQIFKTPCTVEIEHTPLSLHAHVELMDNFEIRPGDQVLVHDAPTNVPFGERIVVSRMATVVRAGPIEQAWIRFAGNLEITELYDVSFTERRVL
jgi:hypothetical protein